MYFKENRMKIFIYGSLKKGFYNHDVLKSIDARFIKNVQTTPDYLLVDLTYFPGLVRSENGKSIKGELYEIDEQGKKILDILEAVPTLYKDEVIQLNTGQNVMTYIYVKPYKNNKIMKEDEWN